MSRVTISLPPAQQLVDGKLTGATGGATYPILDPMIVARVGNPATAELSPFGD